MTADIDDIPEAEGGGVEAEGFEIRAFTPYLLNMAAEATSEGFAECYKTRYGMTRTEWRVLFHLGRYGPLSAHEVGRRSRLHKTKISRAVRALEEKRFLHRETSPDDRRVEILSLRKAGEDAFTVLVGLAEDYERRLQKRLGARRAAILKRALQQLAELE